jgi:hypothetical protein
MLIYLLNFSLEYRFKAFLGIFNKSLLFKRSILKIFKEDFKEEKIKQNNPLLNIFFNEYS